MACYRSPLVLEFASFLQVMMFMLKYNIGKRVKYINKYILDGFFH